MQLRFDLGTILLDAVPPGVDAAHLPETRWDPRVAAYRAPADAHGRLSRALTSAGVRIADVVRQPGRPADSFVPIELRPYQEAALDAWERAGRRGTVVLPTGSGKTRLAAAALARLRVAALCLVPTRALLSQWRDVIAASYRGPIGCLGDGERTVEAITVATYASAAMHLDRIGNRFDLLVVDEAHHAATDGWSDVLSLSIAEARLGLTATPPRGEGAERLAASVGPLVFELTIADLAGGFLASFDRICLPCPLTPDEKRRYDDERRIFSEYRARYRSIVPEATWIDLLAAAGGSAEGRRALAAWRQTRAIAAFSLAKRAAIGSLLVRHAQSKILIFVADNASAYAVAREHLVMPITCDIGRSERAHALERFRKGELRALVSAQVLNEGLDVPDAEVGIVVGAAGGEREHVQRVGRLLRPAPGKRAVVYELVSTGTSEEGRARRRGLALSPRHAAQL